MPVYESDVDRSEQRKLEALLAAIGCVVDQTQTLCEWDFVIRKSGFVSVLAEFKCRQQQYATLVVDRLKIDNLISAAKKSEAVPVLIVRWKGIDGYWVWICRSGMPARRFKRLKKRGVTGETDEAWDVVYDIDISEFRRLQA